MQNGKLIVNIAYKTVANIYIFFKGYLSTAYPHSMLKTEPNKVEKLSKLLLLKS